MAGETMRFRNPAGHRGLLSNLLAVVNTLDSFEESRNALLKQESKSALLNVVLLVAFLAVAAMLCAVGFVFLIAGIIVLLAHALHVSWIWVALVVALLHFVLALFCVLIARSRMTKPMFRVTAGELKKDREWLKNLEKTNLSAR
jgi:uncharacterized membrane protein YqjE